MSTSDGVGDLEEQARQRKAKLQALKARRDESSNVRSYIGTHFANSQNYCKTLALSAHASIQWYPSPLPHMQKEGEQSGER